MLSLLAASRCASRAAFSTATPPLAARAAARATTTPAKAEAAAATVVVAPRRLFAADAAATAAAAAARPAVTTFSGEEELLRESVARLAKEEIGPRVASMDREGELDAAVLPACFAGGLMGVETPEALGGAGLNFTASCIVIEELAKVDPAVSVIVDVQNTLVCTALRKWGSAEQRQQWLPRLAADTVGSFCLSEWGSGSDAFALKTRATAAADGSGDWVLEGGKAWITNAREAGVFLVLATVDPALGYKGITAFVVPRGTPGLRVGKKEDKLGIRASSTCEVLLEGVRVPRSAVLGEVGKGYKIAIESLNEGRIGIGAQMLGLAEGAFQLTMPYLLQRKQFGRAIADFQGMQFNYATCATDIMAARLMVYNAARLKDAGQPFVQEASMAKLYASQAAERVASKCIEMLGGVGFTRELGVEKFFRDCKIGQIYEGTTNIQLQTIAKALQKEFSA